MSWQDIVLTIGSLLLIVAPLQMITDPPPWRASALTAGVLAAFTAAYSTLAPVAAVTTAFCCGAWLFLLIRKLRH